LLLDPLTPLVFRERSQLSPPNRGRHNLRVRRVHCPSPLTARISRSIPPQYRWHPRTNSCGQHPRSPVGYRQRGPGGPRLLRSAPRFSFRCAKHSCTSPGAKPVSSPRLKSHPFNSPNSTANKSSSHSPGDGTLTSRRNALTGLAPFSTQDHRNFSDPSFNAAFRRR